MPQIPINVARRRGIARLVTCLREQLATEVEATRDALVDTGELLSAPYCPTPPREAVYATSPRSVEDVVRNHDAVIFVWPNSPRRAITSASGSGGLNTYKQPSKLEVAVVVVFRYALQPSDVLDADGVKLDQEQEMQLRAEIYTGGIIDCLCKYAPDPDSVHHIQPLSDDAEAFSLYADEGMLVGLAAVTFELTQTLTVPERRPLP